MARTHRLQQQTYADAVQTRIVRPQASSNAQWIKRARQLHLYLGTLFAPSILFFALTGAAMVLNLHEPRERAPFWLRQVAQIHKKQKPLPPDPPSMSKVATAPDPKPAPKQAMGTRLLKFFFCAAALGLSATTLLGIYMAFQFNRRPIVLLGLLLLGSAIPLLMVLRIS
jgi:hypothetical protein